MSEQPAGSGHDDHDVHIYEGTGIEEGNARVPKWYLGVILILATFAVVYLVRYMDGVQPSAAEFKK